MTTAQLKKAMGLLRQAYKQLKSEALDAGMDIMSPEFDDIIAKARKDILESLGFTVDEYRRAKAKAQKFSQVEMLELAENTKAQLEEFNNRYIPNDTDISLAAQKAAEEVYRKTPPQIVHKIIKEVTVEKPQVIKETKIEKTTEMYDDSQLKKELKDLGERFNKLPKPLQAEALQQFFDDNFSKYFEHNINILGMPDFRKLAMGLDAKINQTQAQVDSLSVGSLTVLTKATGDIDDSNTTFTFSSAPTVVVVNGATYRNGAGVTITGTTAELDNPVGTGGDIYGLK